MLGASPEMVQALAKRAAAQLHFIDLCRLLACSTAACLGAAGGARAHALGNSVGSGADGAL